MDSEYIFLFSEYIFLFSEYISLQKYKTKGERILFDEQFTLERLSAVGNPLEKISNVIDFEIFRATLELKLLNTEKNNNARAKPFDVVMIFKVMILQRNYGLGETQEEYQIIDRLSFKKFLELKSGNKVPDEKTVLELIHQNFFQMLMLSL